MICCCQKLLVGVLLCAVLYALILKGQQEQTRIRYIHNNGIAYSCTDHYGTTDYRLISCNIFNCSIVNCGIARDSTIHYDSSRDSPIHYDSSRDSPIHYDSSRDSPIHYYKSRYSTIHYDSSRYSTIHYDIAFFSAVQTILDFDVDTGEFSTVTFCRITIILFTSVDDGKSDGGQSLQSQLIHSVFYITRQIFTQHNVQMNWTEVHLVDVFWVDYLWQISRHLDPQEYLSFPRQGTKCGVFHQGKELCSKDALQSRKLNMQPCRSNSSIQCTCQCKISDRVHAETFKHGICIASPKSDWAFHVAQKSSCCTSRSGAVEGRRNRRLSLAPWSVDLTPNHRGQLQRNCLLSGAGKTERPHKRANEHDNADGKRRNIYRFTELVTFRNKHNSEDSRDVLILRQVLVSLMLLAILLRDPVVRKTGGCARGLITRVPQTDNSVFTSWSELSKICLGKCISTFRMPVIAASEYRGSKCCKSIKLKEKLSHTIASTIPTNDYRTAPEKNSSLPAAQTNIWLFPATFLPNTTSTNQDHLQHVGVRLASLAALPPSCNLYRVRLAEAGFFYDPRVNRDAVICYKCGVQYGLDSSSQNGSPLEHHRLKSPNCPFLKSLLESYTINPASLTQPGPKPNSLAAANSNPSSSTTMPAIASSSPSASSKLPHQLSVLASPPQNATNHLRSRGQPDDIGSPTISTPKTSSTQHHTSSASAPSTDSDFSSLPCFFSTASLSSTSEKSLSSLKSFPPAATTAGMNARQTTDSVARSLSTIVGAVSSVTSTTRQLTAGGDLSTDGESSNYVVPLPGNDALKEYKGTPLDLSGAVYPQYITSESRQASFSKCPLGNLQAFEPKELVNMGFYYAGYADCVRCFFCGIGLKSWVQGDDPLVEHIRWRPNCGFLLSTKGRQFITDTLAKINSGRAGNMSTDSPSVGVNSTRQLTSSGGVPSVPLEIQRQLSEMGFTLESINRANAHLYSSGVTLTIDHFVEFLLQ